MAPTGFRKGGHRLGNPSELEMASSGQLRKGAFPDGEETARLGASKAHQLTVTGGSPAPASALGAAD